MSRKVTDPRTACIWGLYISRCALQAGMHKGCPRASGAKMYFSVC